MSLTERVGGTRVSLSAVLRRCDFSNVSTASFHQLNQFATGWAVVRTAGSNTVVAEVHLVNTDAPGRHYDAELIQEPRPLSSCGPGQPGTTFGALDLDPGGQGMTTLQDTVQSGATGVWVKIQRPGQNAQTPAEYYTSDFLARL